MAVDYEAYGGDRSLVVNWGNHLSLYLSLYPKAQTVFFATHNDGQELSIVKPWPIPPWDLPDNLEYWVNDAGLPCIMNIDLDYFFCTVDDKAIRFLDDAYFDALSAAVARLNKDGKLAVITIALTATDDLTNGWHPAEALATRMCKALGYDFKLPD